MNCQEWEYEVALSFAGEQREYVQEVSFELSKLGIKHFYDMNEQSNLWGKNLTRYLNTVYFSKSRYFVPFISYEYKEKAWTTWEMDAALERYLNQRSDYILPVVMDDARIEGLVKSIGYIDARKTSPYQLARLIEKKVRGVNFVDANNSLDSIQTADDLADDNRKPCNTCDIYTLEKEALNSVYQNATSSKGVVVFGEKGLGKRTTINQFLRNKSNVIHVVPKVPQRFQLESIFSVLELNQSESSVHDDLMFPERVKKALIRKCNEKSSILYFEGLDNFDNSTLFFIIDFTKDILQHYPDLKTCIILEFDDDSERGKLVNQAILTFPPNSVEFIPFSRLTNEQLLAYMKFSFGQIKIPSQSLDYIIRSSYGNIQYLNVILNYLRVKGIIKQSDDHFVCDFVKNGMLSDILQDYLKQRYERLDNDLKIILSKSAIIGNTFKSELLSRPFGVINADEILKKIEAISSLIRHETDEKFSFENKDSFDYVCTTILPNEARQWHEILAEYYSRRLRNRTEMVPISSPTDQIAAIFPIAWHYRKAEKFEKSIEYYLSLMRWYYAISDFSNTLNTAEEIKGILDRVDVEYSEVERVKYYLSFWEAKCQSAKGHYPNAIRLYSYCVEHAISSLPIDEVAELRLDLALCQYMNGETEASLEIALSVKKALEKEKNQNLSFYKALSLLASIYDFTWNDREKRQLYLQAINYCREYGHKDEYYHLLKKASMVYDELISVGMYPAVIEYYQSTNQIKNLAETYHNVATDLLYIARFDSVLSNLESICIIVQRDNQISATYIRNPLKTAKFEKRVRQWEWLCLDYQGEQHVFEL